jgi:hypothetical protein
MSIRASTVLMAGLAASGLAGSIRRRDSDVPDVRSGLRV